MNTLLIPSYSAAIFDIIDDECTIVNDFTESSNIIDLFFIFAVEFCDEHAEDGSPSFSSSI